MSSDTVWAPCEAVGWMIQCEQAESGLEEVKSSIFRQQLRGSLTFGFEPYWVSVEEEWKAQTDGKALPSKFRSSKSVIKSVLDEGVDPVDPQNGEYLGKTALEKAVKQARALKNGMTEVNPAVDAALDLDYYKKQVSDMHYGAIHNLTGEEFNALVRHINTLFTPFREGGI